VRKLSLYYQNPGLFLNYIFALLIEKNVLYSQHVIAYDLDKSLKNDKIELSTIIKIEQTAIPKAGLVLPPSVSKKFNIANKSTVLMSNDELKLKIYSLPDFVLLHTFVGPLLMGHGVSSCIQQMQVK
jgi:hypothetical protein